jgi:hypothetical protein
MPRADFAPESEVRGAEFDNIFELLDEVQAKSKEAGQPAVSQDDPRSLRLGWALLDPVTGELDYYWFIRLQNLKRSLRDDPRAETVKSLIMTSEGRVRIALDLFAA